MTPTRHRDSRSTPTLKLDGQNLPPSTTISSTLTEVRTAPPEHAGPAPFPERIGCYQVLDVLASGAQGTVFRAIHVELGKHAALKLLPRAKQDDVAVKRFLREMRTAAGLRHPNLVTVLDGGIIDDVPYLVMELVGGTTLR